MDIASDTQALNGSLASNFRFTDANEVVTGMTATMSASDTLLDASTTDNDVLNVTLTGDTTITTVNIETINLSYVVAAADFTAANTGTKIYNVSGSVAGKLSTPQSGATIALNDYGRVMTVEGLTLTGTTTAGNAESLSISLSGATFGTTTSTQTGVTIDGTDGQQLETLNIASNGSSANTFALAFEATETVGTYTITGAQDLTMRVDAAKVSGTTINATANTGKVGVSLDTGADITVSAANWTGVDNIILRDSDTTPGAATLNSTASGQNVVVANSVSTLTVAATGATFSSMAAAASLELNGTSTTAGVTVGTYAVQNTTALNLSSLGLASSTSTTAANTISNLDGDFTKITITGDTSLKITDLDIEATETATTTTARAVTVDASAMTGNAFVDITASADSKVSYTITGTAGADTIVMNQSGGTVNAGAGKDKVTSGDGKDTVNLGAGDDTYVVSFGEDKLTLGAGNDTVDINAAKAAAVQHKVDVDFGALIVDTGVTAPTGGAALAATDQFVITIGGAGYTYIVPASGVAEVGAALANFVTAHGAAIQLATGVTVSVDATNDELVFTGKTDGTQFTVDGSYSDGGTIVAITEVVDATGSAAKVVNTTITDFAAGDILDVAGLLTSAAAYHEGTAATAADGDSIIVLTAVSYASAALAQAAIDIDTTGDDGLIIFLNSTTGKAEAFYDVNTDTTTDGADGTTVFVFENITNLTDLASIMSADSFVV